LQFDRIEIFARIGTFDPGTARWERPKSAALYNPIQTTMLDIIEAIIVAIFFWRIAVAFLISNILGFIISSTIPTIGTAIGIAIAVSGLTFGIYWQARHEDGLGLTEHRVAKAPSISQPVAALGLIFIGFLWGGIFTVFTRSYWMSALSLLLTSIPVLAWNKVILHARLDVRTLWFAYGFLSIGFGLGACYQAITNTP
jgi:hypothetical protein